MATRISKPQLKVERLPLAGIKLEPQNCRRHAERNIATIKASLEQFGQQKAITIDYRNCCLAGNGTVIAARELGWTHIDACRSALRGKDARAYSIVDNRASDLSEFDFEELAGHLKSLKAANYNLQALGWEAHEIEPLLKATWTPPPLAELPTRTATTESLSDEDRQVIDEAISHYRKSHAGLTDSECLARICRFYLDHAGTKKLKRAASGATG